MDLIKISINRPVFAWVLMFSLIVFGAVSLNRLGISQMPDVNFPILSISIQYEGAAPEVVEADLLDPIEAKLLSVEGIKEMRSSASQGEGNVTLEFGIERNIDIALQEVQSALSQLRMPTGVDPPVIRKQNPEEDPVLYMSVYGGANLKEMVKFVDGYLLDQIRFLPGVGEVSIQGFSERNLRIWLDAKKLGENDLTISDVVEALKTQHIESAAGDFTEGKRELRVRWLGEAADVNEIQNIRILKRGGQIIHNRSIYIKDVATVEDGLSDIKRVARVDGKNSINISIKKQRGTNEVTVAKMVREKMIGLKERFPKGFDYRINVDFTKSTESTVNLTKEKLWVAALITILVCYLFLGSIPAAVNILFSIPTSIIGTFSILYLSGFTLNLFTLLALTLSISIVVDDAIMLLENIMRHYRMKKPSHIAAYDGSREVLPAATAASLAVVAVFLPVIFMSGVIGKFFFQFGVTMSAAVLLSLLEAVTITPMRAAAFLRAEPKTSPFEEYLDQKFHKMGKNYGSLLRKALLYRWTVLLASTAIFLCSLYLSKRINQEFVPSQDQNIILVISIPPPGTSLESANLISQELETIAKANPYVKGFFVSVGTGGPGGSSSSIFLPLELIPREERDKNHQEIMQDLRKEFQKVKGTRVVMRDISARNLVSGSRNPLAFNLRGPNLDELNKQADQLINYLEKSGLGVDMDKDFRTGMSELIIIPNRENMAARGVSVESVGQILAAAVGGIVQGRYTSDGRRYDIRFKLKEGSVTSPKDLERLYVRNIVGNLIPLSEIVSIQERKASVSISRINRQRAITVYGNLPPGGSQNAALQASEEYLKKNLAPGYAYSLAGAAAGFTESFRSLFLALIIGILVAYLILAVQFNSFIHPISVLMALPFSVSGAFLTLWLTNQSLSIFSYIGLIVLMGITKKNSIMLIEFANQIREKDHSPVRDALIQSGTIRLRPILMTSIATITAAIPLVLGSGLGHETRAPMGWAIIGGSLISTVFTLFVVPAIYELLTHFESKSRRSI